MATADAIPRPEFLQVAEAVAREKLIEREEVLEAMEMAMGRAGRQTYGQNKDIRAEIDRTLDWKRRGREAATGYGGLCVAPYHHAHFDELMADMGARTKPANTLAAHFAPISPESYAGLLATAPRP